MDTGSAAVLIFIAVLVYFLPSIVAAGKKNNGGVLVVNLFLGWTLVGWVVALAWAVTLSRNEQPSVSTVDRSGHLISATQAIDTRQCPFCAEEIKAQAIVCKHCGRDVPKAESIVTKPTDDRDDPPLVLGP